MNGKKSGNPFRDGIHPGELRYGEEERYVSFSSAEAVALRLPSSVRRRPASRRRRLERAPIGVPVSG
ncbi:hypothetical protein [Streptomyces coffeae]|uniref:Uncharacterized protein n=1 Tax=Streptomyces coffeae TaxID=621382 RepID=A0ABS1NKY6_9ACTN|nr:hypothetical protein [Streptomyces coffeae]MBL1100582.1 hypothetical protein [Streptomyces coffeae]